MSDEQKKTTIIYVTIFALVIAIICFYNWKVKCHYKDCDKDKAYGSEYCHDHTCKDKGCYAIKAKEEEWCATHKAIHEEEGRKWREAYNKKPDCIVKDCKFKAQQEGGYCVVHRCIRCNNRCIDGKQYCINHTCKEPGCFNGVKEKNTTCDSCKNEAIKKKNAEIARQNEKYKKSTSKKTTKKYSMPDCDDYDSYDDFMDDWDGFMPDGSDAEDYWENW